MDEEEFYNANNRDFDRRYSAPVRAPSIRAHWPKNTQLQLVNKLANKGVDRRNRQNEFQRHLLNVFNAQQAQLSAVSNQVLEERHARQEMMLLLQQVLKQTQVNHVEMKAETHKVLQQTMASQRWDQVPVRELPTFLANQIMGGLKSAAFAPISLPINLLCEGHKIVWGRARGAIAVVFYLTVVGGLVVLAYRVLTPEMRDWAIDAGQVYAAPTLAVVKASYEVAITRSLELMTAYVENYCATASVFNPVCGSYRLGKLGKFALGR